MKKSLWGITGLAIVAALLCAGMWTGAPVSLNASAVQTDLRYMPGRNNTFEWGYENGIYVFKSETTAQGVFVGDVNIGPTLLSMYTDYQFQAKRFVNGSWQDTDWFQVNRSYSGVSCDYEIRKNLPTGKYGIEATAYKDGEKVVYDYTYGWGEPVAVTSIYAILYADDLNYITLRDSSYKNLTRARDVVGKTISIFIDVNSGAMNRENVGYEIDMEGSTIGNLEYDPYTYMAMDITASSLYVWVERNGKAVDFPFVVSGNQIFLLVPNSLSAGQYVVKATHTSDPGIFGQYVIDNSGGSFSLAGVAPFFLVLGLLGAIGGLALLLGPRFYVKYAEMRYQKIEKAQRNGGKPDDMFVDDDAPKGRGSGLLGGLKRFWKNFTGKEPLPAKAPSSGGKVDESKLTPEQREKLDKERYEKLQKSKSASFMSKLAENRQKREIAREEGLTMEEFKEIEKKQKELEEAGKHSLKGFRSASDAPDIVETPHIKDEGPKNIDGFETDMLESVKKEVPFKESQFAESTFKPNVATGGEGSVLSRLQNLTGGGSNVSVTDESASAAPVPQQPVQSYTPEPEPESQSFDKTHEKVKITEDQTGTRSGGNDTWSADEMMQQMDAPEHIESQGFGGDDENK